MEFTAMGSLVSVHLVGGRAGLGEKARRRIDDLERKWSRFIPHSEVGVLNEHGSSAVSPDTAELIAKAIAGWQLTGGAFDPTVHDAVVAAGYDRSFELIDGSGASRTAAPTPGCGGIAVTGTFVSLPAGVRLDPGGIGKGLAGDIVARELMADGAAGVAVSLGGDVRVAGHARDGTPWHIVIDEPEVNPAPLATIPMINGAVATSTTKRRRWRTATGPRHHIIDPATGSSTKGPVLASAIARECWWAEVVAKAMLVIDPEAVPSWTTGVVGLVVDANNAERRIGGFGRFEL